MVAFVSTSISLALKISIQSLRKWKARKSTLALATKLKYLADEFFISGLIHVIIHLSFIGRSDFEKPSLT